MISQIEQHYPEHRTSRAKGDGFSCDSHLLLRVNSFNREKHFLCSIEGANVLSLIASAHNPSRPKHKHIHKQTHPRSTRLPQNNPSQGQLEQCSVKNPN